MRLRIQTLPPLPELKAWFIPRPTGAIIHLNTILELKQAICHDIKQLHQDGLQYSNTRLLLDDFELLDDLPFNEVLRDGNLVCIQLSLEAREASRKRKVTDDTEGAFVSFSIAI